MRGCKSFSERALAKFDGQWWNPFNLRQPYPPSQPPFQRRQSSASVASLTNNRVVALLRRVVKRGRSWTGVSSTFTDKPLTRLQIPLPKPQTSRHVLTNGNGITLLPLSSISSSADSDMIRQPMITEEEWNGAQHAYQKTMDNPNNLGRYKLKARLRRKKCLKRVE